MAVKEAASDSEFGLLLKTDNRLTIVDFHAQWCGPCKMLSPVFKNLASLKPKMTFIAADIDKCPLTAAAYGVKAVPTFIAFYNTQKLDVLRGPGARALEEWIERFEVNYNGADEESEVPGMLELSSFIQTNQVECLNEDDANNIAQFYSGAPERRLVSDCDEQFLITLPFNRAVKLHSIAIRGPGDAAPKIVKVFQNTSRSLDFDEAQSAEPVQTLDFSKDDIAALRFVKFQNVQNVVLFVENNKGDLDQTVITDIKLYGQVVGANTNMGEFKRIAGKAGEADH